MHVKVNVKINVICVRNYNSVSTPVNDAHSIYTAVVLQETHTLRSPLYNHVQPQLFTVPWQRSQRWLIAESIIDRIKRGAITLFNSNAGINNGQTVVSKFYGNRDL